MRFGVYFERILKLKWLFSKEIIIVYLQAYILGARRHMLHKNFLKIWCSFVRFGVYFDHIVS